MPDIQVYEAPILPAALETKWSREHRAFLSLLPQLLATHRGQFVAIHDGRVAAAGTDRVTLALEVYRRHGYQPIHIGLVTTDPPAVERVPSSRNADGATR